MTNEIPKVGDKIRFDDEKQRYTVMARDARYVILTKPLNCRKTYLYTIVDLVRMERGPNNLIFGPIVPFNTIEGAAENLAMLQSGEQEVSKRFGRSKDLSGNALQFFGVTE